MTGPGREFAVAWQADASELPLWGRRIMVTGPRQYAGKLAGLLLAAGARPVWLPTIAIRRLTEPAHLQVGLPVQHGMRSLTRRECSLAFSGPASAGMVVGATVAHICSTLTIDSANLNATELSVTSIVIAGAGHVSGADRVLFIRRVHSSHFGSSFPINYKA